MGPNVVVDKLWVRGGSISADAEAAEGPAERREGLIFAVFFLDLLDSLDYHPASICIMAIDDL